MMLSRSLLLIIAGLGPCLGHVSLTFPPARKYALDFLDVIRTPPPCGMSKGLGPTTTLRAGSSLTVEWHLAYPHSGGFKLTLLDANEQPIYDLTNGVIDNCDPTVQSHSVTLPDVTCNNCSIQLLRHAGEWSTSCNNGRYEFHSCADVDIVQVPVMTCSGHGGLVGGSCSCNRLWAGNHCQYREECQADEDCGTDGLCVIGLSTTFPKNRCYCAAGWFGKNCQKRSSLRSVTMDTALYERTALAGVDDFVMYHRILRDSNEIEVVLKSKTDSWVGIGWRPTDLRTGCQNVFPRLPAFPVRQHNPHPRQWCPGGGDTCLDKRIEWSYEGSTSLVVTVTVSGLTSVWDRWFGVGITNTPSMTSSDIAFLRWTVPGSPELTDRFVREIRQLPTIDVESNINVRSVKFISGVLTYTFSRDLITSDSVNDVEIDGNRLYLLFAHGEVKEGVAFPHSKDSKYVSPLICLSTECEAIHAPEPEGEKEPGAEATQEPIGEPTQEPIGEPTQEPIGEPTQEPTGEGEGEPGAAKCGRQPPGDTPTSGAVLDHPMDCSDVIIGSARGSRSRVGDFYTRDRSTPQPDSFYGHEDSLTAAVGEERNGFTTIMFRRKLDGVGIDQADHALRDAAMRVIWARGQTSGNVNHFPNSGLETCNRDKNFYQTDELKYHGRDSQNTTYGHRGFTTLNFFDIGRSGDCPTSWEAPSKNYSASWHVNSETREVTITLSARLGNSQWMAFGLNPQRKMIGNSADSYIAWMDGDVPVVSDRHNRQYGPPAIDSVQNVKVVNSSVVNGRTTITFSRPLNTDDNTEDYNGDCAYHLYSWGGNVQSDGSLGIHNNEKFASPEQICFTTCEPTGGISVLLRVPFFFTLDGLVYIPAYGDSNSPEYRKLDTDVVNMLNTHMSGVRGFQMAYVIRFTRGSVVVEAALNVQRSAPSEAQARDWTKRDVTTALENMVQRPSAGGFVLDDTPESYNVRNPEPVSQTPSQGGDGDEDENDLGNTEKVIIAVVVAGFCLLVILACGAAYRRKLERPKVPPVLTDAMYMHTKPNMALYNSTDVSQPPSYNNGVMYQTHQIYNTKPTFSSSGNGAMYYSSPHYQDNNTYYAEQNYVDNSNFVMYEKPVVPPIDTGSNLSSVYHLQFKPTDGPNVYQINDVTQQN